MKDVITAFTIKLSKKYENTVFTIEGDDESGGFFVWHNNVAIDRDLVFMSFIGKFIREELIPIGFYDFTVAYRELETSCYFINGIMYTIMDSLPTISNESLVDFSLNSDNHKTVIQEPSSFAIPCLKNNLFWPYDIVGDITPSSMPQNYLAAA